MITVNLAHYKQLADNYHVAAAQYKYAELLFQHSDVLETGKEIVEYALKASVHPEKIEPRAYALLAELYVDGVGVASHPQEALIYCRMAQEHNMSAGWVILGRMYDRGVGCEKILKQPVFVIKKQWI